jgi:hypothetical protein
MGISLCLEQGHEGHIREVPREDHCSSMYIDYYALLSYSCKYSHHDLHVLLSSIWLSILPSLRVQNLTQNTNLWRACNLTPFSPCLTGPVDYLFASHHKGLRFKYPGGYLCETGILLLALSCYIGYLDMIHHFCGLV